MKHGDKALIWLLVVVFVVSGGFVVYKKRHQEGKIAVILSGGKPVERIDLDRVREPYEFTVWNGQEYNVVRVEPGRIRTVDASCYNHIDVAQGWISDSTQLIVCIPNDLLIYIEDKNYSSENQPVLDLFSKAD